jgi:hypothetical protein
MDFGREQAEARSFMIKFYLEDKVNRDTLILVTNFLQNHLMSQQKIM